MTMCRDALVRRVRYGNGRTNPGDGVTLGDTDFSEGDESRLLKAVLLPRVPTVGSAGRSRREARCRFWARPNDYLVSTNRSGVEIEKTNLREFL